MSDEINIHNVTWGPSRGLVNGRPVPPDPGEGHPGFVKIPPLCRPVAQIEVATLREEGIEDRCPAPGCTSIDMATTRTRAVCLRCNWQGTPAEAVAAATSYKATLKDPVVKVGPVSIRMRELAGTGSTKDAASNQVCDLIGRAVAQAYLDYKNGSFHDQEIAKLMELGS